MVKICGLLAIQMGGPPGCLGLGPKAMFSRWWNWPLKVVFGSVHSLRSTSICSSRMAPRLA